MQKVILSALIAGAAGANVDSSPLGQAISLLNDLAKQVQKDGEAEQKAYEEYFEWCDDVAKEKGFEIKTAGFQKQKLEASIAELASQMTVCDTKVAQLVEAIGANGKDLEAATKIRAEEASVFASNEAELQDVVKTLSGAIKVLEKEMGSAAFAQVSNGVGLTNALPALNAIMDAASFSGSDKKKLAALVQAHQDSEEDDEETGAPAAANYAKKSGGVLDVLQDMKAKADGQLSELRGSEQNSKFTFQKLSQSLQDQLAYDKQELEDQKKKKAGAEEGKATAEGELAITIEDLKSGDNALETAQKNCMTVAGDHEAVTRSRAEEMKVIKDAVKVLQDSGAASFMQIAIESGTEASTENVKNKVAQFVRKYARDHHSNAMMQLAQRIMTVGRLSSDPFVKIRGMIEDMIKKIEDSMSSEASEKAYCDEEMAKSKTKKGELEYEMDKVTNKIDKASARSAELKENVKVLQEELAKMAREQQESDEYRRDQHAAYVTAQADATESLAGVRKALSVLRDYYAAGSASAASAALVQDDQPALPKAFEKKSGAGGSIISILEVVESDMAKALAKLETEEQDEVSTYEQTTYMNKVTKTSKDQDVKYKVQEAASLDKAITEHTNDRDETSAELAAVSDYFMKLKGRCIAKPTPYSEIKKAREAEIEGLKQALDVLENEAALVQRSSKKGRNMRGGALQL